MKQKKTGYFSLENNNYEDLTNNFKQFELMNLVEFLDKYYIEASTDFSLTNLHIQNTFVGLFEEETW